MHTRIARVGTGVPSHPISQNYCCFQREILRFPMILQRATILVEAHQVAEPPGLPPTRTCPINGVIVITEDAHFFPFPNSHLGHEGHKVVWAPQWVLPNEAGGVRPNGVEVPKQHQLPLLQDKKEDQNLEHHCCDCPLCYYCYSCSIHH